MLPSQQRTTGFALQSFFIGTGAVVASALPYMMTNWFNISNTAAQGEIPPSVEFSFYLGAVAFILAVVWTVIKTKEYPPEQFNAFYGDVAEHQESEGMKEIFTDFMKMPKTMVQLALVQYFSWFALFAMWLYTTAAVTAHIYGTSDTSSKLYNEGADWVGVCFAAYNGFAAIMSFFLPVLARKTSRKIVHMISLVAGGLGLASIYFIQNPNLLIVSMLGIGLAWASILSMPYAILAGSLPARKMGTYMGIFNFFIVIPQITAAAILGYFTQLFNGEAVYVLLLGGASMFLAAVLTLIVKDVDDDASEVSETERLTISKDMEIHNK
jgi:maltose/moltooligosaccharide transporter